MSDNVNAAVPLGARLRGLVSSAKELSAKEFSGTYLLKETLAGLVAAVVLAANIVSFGALMFPGDRAIGMPIAIWAMLIGSCITGIYVALKTSLPPIATGIDSPTGAVLILLSASAGSTALAAGASPLAAAHITMVCFTATTILSGLILFGLGARKYGAYFRFVPSFVVGGFLAATGWFLISGAVRMSTGRALNVAALTTSWPPYALAKLCAGLATLGIFLLLRRSVKSPFAMPLMLLALCALSSILLRSFGLSGTNDGWYLPSLGNLRPWMPLFELKATGATWPMIWHLLPEMMAAAVVALISLVAKVSAMEVTRRTSGDLDLEFRNHGIASLIAAPMGGVLASMQTGSSRLLDQLGGTGWLCGTVAAAVLGLIAVTGFDLPGRTPIPVVAGLVFFLGYNFILEALARPITQRAWLDAGLAIAIAIVCVVFGYLAGVIAGVIGACLLFVVSYARIGAIRRTASRANCSSHVERSPEATTHLNQVGDAIQIYWLSGFIFFGSSEGIFERIRGDVSARPQGGVAFVILECGQVTGADSSAVFSLIKLRDYCQRQGATLVYASLSPSLTTALVRGGFFPTASTSHTFINADDALAACEDKLLASAKLDLEPKDLDFTSWLQQRLPAHTSAAALLAYFERRCITTPCVVYETGQTANTVDLVATGSLTVDRIDEHGDYQLLRRFMTHTVIGEMGFFRRAQRFARVSAVGPTTLYTLTHENFERMQRERPDLAVAFQTFIISVLADRVEFYGRASSAGNS
jgi:sulfate permease, SulP family